MTHVVRLGTRGSDLAMCQARTVAALLREHAGVEAQIVVIETEGDRQADAPMTPQAWTPGAFVTQIEQALRADQVDVAVHSYKDMTTQINAELPVVATPQRAVVHDVLVCSSAEQAALVSQAISSMGADEAVAELVVGSSSPRRAFQLRTALGCRIEPIRGNVPTRLAKLSGDYDAVCLAGAGLARLGLAPQHAVALPVDRFPTAAAQGAVAIQARAGTKAAVLAARLNHAPTRAVVEAERAFLRAINAGCHTPVAATASHDDAYMLCLHVQYFDQDGACFDKRFHGSEPEVLGSEAADELRRWKMSC